MKISGRTVPSTNEPAFNKRSVSQLNSPIASQESDPVNEIRELLNKLKKDTEELQSKHEELDRQQTNHNSQIVDVNQTMKIVVIVLVVMVGAMILSLQIAVMQSLTQKENTNNDIHIFTTSRYIL